MKSADVRHTLYETVLALRLEDAADVRCRRIFVGLLGGLLELALFLRGLVANRHDFVWRKAGAISSCRALVLGQASITKM